MPRKKREDTPARFIAVDGEGTTINDEHLYTLLAASDGSKIVDTNGLDTIACLDYLIQLKLDNPDHYFVSFYFSYDVNMILRDYPRASIIELCNTNKCTVRSHEHKASYSVTYIPTKFVKITKYSHSEEGKKVVATIKIFDTFGFFQGSFLKAIDLYKIASPDELAFIDRMKQKRSDFTPEDDKIVDEYNQLECALLVRLMERLDTCLRNIDLKLNSWLGAGAIAAKLMNNYDIKSHLQQPVKTHVIPAMSAYFGGRIQALQLGEFSGVHAYDVVSAYPSVIENLPSLTNMKQYTTLDYEPENPYVIYHIKWKLPPDTLIAPFPFRAPDGGIHYPLEGEGYYWSCEVETALKYYPCSIKIIMAYGFLMATDLKPFAFVRELFEARKVYKANNDHTQLVIKLGLNSLYGKTAQTVGFENTAPPFQSFIWAGLITATVRASLYNAVMEAPGDVIAFATDGIYSLGELPTLAIGENLGEWEHTKYDTMFIAKPGFYQLMKGNKETSTTRGFRRSTINFNHLKAVWNSHGISGKITVQDTHFLGMKQTKGNPAKWRRWIVTPRTLNLWPSRDYPQQTNISPCQFRMLPPASKPGVSLPYKYTPLDENIESEIID